MSGSLSESTRSSLAKLLHGCRFMLPALPLLLCHLALLIQFDLAVSPGWTVVLMALSFCCYVYAARRFDGLAVPTVSLLIVAATLRLILLPLPPTLSDDTLRYVWDGRVTTAGFNPYELPPESPVLAELRDELWLQMPHQQVPTVYPPLALAVFSIASRLPHPLIGIKILLSFADLVGCFLLIILARRLAMPAGRAVWYAWNPLVVLEVAGMGHVDGMMTAFMIATVLALVSNRTATAGVAAAAGVLSKLVPLIALPFWARASDRPWRFAVAAGIAVVVGLLPVVASVGVPPGLVTYGVSWEFNGPLYEPLWRLIDRAEVVEPIKSVLTQLRKIPGLDEFWKPWYHYVYPQFLAKMLLAGGFAILCLRLWWQRPKSPVVVSGRVLGGVLLCMATVYPWYLLWVLPWAALTRHRAWLALSALLPLSYLPQNSPGVELFPWVWAVIWLPFFLLLYLEPAWSTD